MAIDYNPDEPAIIPDAFWVIGCAIASWHPSPDWVPLKVQKYATFKDDGFP